MLVAGWFGDRVYRQFAERCGRNLRRPFAGWHSRAPHSLALCVPHGECCCTIQDRLRNDAHLIFAVRLRLVSPRIASLHSVGCS
jgi:hypothetical protein